MATDLYEELATVIRAMIADGSLRYVAPEHLGVFEKHGFLKMKGFNLEKLNEISAYLNEPMRDDAFGRRARTDLTQLVEEHWEYVQLVDVLLQWLTGMTSESHLRMATQEFLRRRKNAEDEGGAGSSERRASAKDNPAS